MSDYKYNIVCNGLHIKLAIFIIIFRTEINFSGGLEIWRSDNAKAPIRLNLLC